ncbi:MAG: 7TM diverse intracellular signaling domain-containing protein [Oligoflexus sp.]
MLVMMRSKTMGWLAVAISCLLSAKPTLACNIEGVCDLRATDWSKQEPVSVDGDWEFYWQQILSPQDIQDGKGEFTGFWNPTQQWSTVSFGELKLEHNGYATYHSKLLLEPGVPLTIRFTEIASAGVIWVNGKKVAEIGKIGKDQTSEVAHQQKFFYTFQPAQVENTVTIQMSNFSNYFINTSAPIKIAQSDKLFHSLAKDFILDGFIFGAIAIMVFYHFYLWWVRRSRIPPLYYGVFCLALGMRSLVMGQGELLTFMIPNFNFEWQYKLEYWGISIGIAAIVMLTYKLYPKEVNRYLAWALSGSTLIWSILILVTDALFYPKLLPFYQLVTLVTGFSLLTSLVFAAFRKREGAKLFLIGYAIFFASALNDLMDAIGFIDSSQSSHFGVFGFILFQSMILALRFDREYDRAEHAEIEVRSLNEGLEKKVAERTEEITTILKNVKSGFLAVDRDGKILPGFTQSCHEILQKPIEVGQKLVDVFDIKEAMKDHFETAMNQVFDERMPTVVSLAQLPSRLEMNQRTLSLSGAEIRQPGKKDIKAILFTINDVTNLRKAEEKVQYNEMLLNILKEWESFALFLEDFYLEMMQAEKAAHSGDEIKLRTLLHTIKGNLSAFGIQEVAKKIHQIESRSKITASDVVSIKDALQTIMLDNRDLLHFVTQAGRSYRFEEEDIIALKEHIRQLVSEPVAQQILQKIDALSQKPIQSYLDPLASIVSSLSEKLGKEVEFVMQGESLKVNPEFAPVFRNLIHLIRNAVDHGIEYPEDRREKREKARISLSFSRNEDSLRILVEDDGRGLDTQIIAQKAIELGIMSAEQVQTSSDEDLNQLIFHPHFSTAEKLTDISGRGMGMTAMKEAVEQHGGVLKVKSELGQGTCFLIQLPENPKTVKNSLQNAS